jgi:hypothetical protein
MAEGLLSPPDKVERNKDLELVLQGADAHR